MPPKITHTETERTCYKCGLPKPLFDFYADNSSKGVSGTQRMCKTCTRDYRKERRALGKETNTFATKVAINREWRKRNPEKMRAHNMVSKAIQKGLLFRQNCFCGKIGEAHHNDYSKPLEVTWLCREHHAEHHRIHGSEEIPYVDWKFHPRAASRKTTEEVPF
jgi:hypothetical protein